jgi:hypothetical protein
MHRGTEMTGWCTANAACLNFEKVTSAESGGGEPSNRALGKRVSTWLRSKGVGAQVIVSDQEACMDVAFVFLLSLLKVKCKGHERRAVSEGYV